MFQLKRVIICSIKVFDFFVRCIFSLISDKILLGEIDIVQLPLLKNVSKSCLCQNKLQPPYPETT